MKNKLKTARSILIQNVINGKIAEEIAKQDYRKNGFETRETGIGSDFIAIKKIGDKIYKEYVDVKSGNAKLTKKQKQTKSKLKKDNIKYSIYRVTNKHLKFQISNNLELQQFCQNFRFDLSKFPGILTIQDPTNCPNCQLEARGFQNIFTNFGLRNMGNWIVKVQSWCRNCRNYSRRKQK